MRQHEAEKYEAPRLVVFAGAHERMILEFLRKNEGTAYNARTLEKALKIPCDSLRKDLWRLSKAGKIWNPQRGFFSAKCDLNHHQIEKIEKDIPTCLHGMDIKILKTSLPDDFKLHTESCLIRPTGGTNEARNISISETPDEADEARLRQHEAIGVNQTISIIENRDHFMVTVRASENPIDFREGFWLIAMLRLWFGDASSKGTINNLDINEDIPVTYNRNQITVGDYSGACFAAYGKGKNKTRIELRNLNPNLPISEFLDKLKAFFKSEKAAEEKPAAETMKAPEEDKQQQPLPKQKRPPISAFRTGLEIQRTIWGEGYQ